jgi:hypothetical protein
VEEAWPWMGRNRWMPENVFIRCVSGQRANREMDHRRLDHGFAGCRQQLVSFTQASVAIEPPEGALHNPESSVRG